MNDKSIYDTETLLRTMRQEPKADQHMHPNLKKVADVQAEARARVEGLPPGTLEHGPEPIASDGE